MIKIKKTQKTFLHLCRTQSSLVHATLTAVTSTGVRKDPPRNCRLRCFNQSINCKFQSGPSNKITSESTEGMTSNETGIDDNVRQRGPEHICFQTLTKRQQRRRRDHVVRQTFPFAAVALIRRFQGRQLISKLGQDILLSALRFLSLFYALFIQNPATGVSQAFQRRESCSQNHAT